MFLPSSIYLFIKWVLYSSIWGHSTGVSSFRETDFRWEPFIWQHSRSSMAREWCLSRGHADSSLPHVPHTLTSEEPQELSVSPGLFQWLVGGGCLDISLSSSSDEGKTGHPASEEPPTCGHWAHLWEHGEEPAPSREERRQQLYL